MTGCLPPSARGGPGGGGELEPRQINGHERLGCKECRRVLFVNPAVGVAAHPQEPGGITLPLTPYPFLVISFYRKVNKQ